MATPEDWITAAKLLRPQGRRGELLAEPHIDNTVFTPGRRVWLGNDGSVPEASAARDLESAWEPTGRNAGRIVLKLGGVESISDAEALAGQFLLLPVADLPALEDETFRVRDLIGCALYDGDTLAGTVIEVQFPVGPDGRTRLTDAPDLLAVARPSDEGDPDAEPTLVPFVRAWLVNVDLQAKRINMQLPPGLLADAEADTLDSPKPQIPNP